MFNEASVISQPFLINLFAARSIDIEIAAGLFVVPTILNELLLDPQKSGKAMSAVFTMKKFDIETLIKASNNK